MKQQFSDTEQGAQDSDSWGKKKLRGEFCSSLLTEAFKPQLWGEKNQKENPKKQNLKLSPVVSLSCENPVRQLEIIEEYQKGEL